MPISKADIDKLKEAFALDDLQLSLNKLQVTVENNAAKLEDKLNGKFKELDEKFDLLDTKVSKIDNTLSADILKVKTDISSLVEANTSLTLLADQTKVILDKSVEELREKTVELEDKISENETSVIWHDSELEKLKLKLEKLEKACYSNLQHSRKSNVQVDGIPSVIGDDPRDLETAFLEILRGIGVEIRPIDIEAIHRLPSRSNGIKPTIVKIHNRKMVEDINRKKNKLKNLSSLDINIAGLTPTSEIYIKPSLSPYNNTLAYNCRLLKRDNLILKVITEDDGTLKIKTLNEGNA